MSRTLLKLLLQSILSRFLLGTIFGVAILKALSVIFNRNFIPDDLNPLHDITFNKFKSKLKNLFWGTLQSALFGVVIGIATAIGLLTLHIARIVFTKLLDPSILKDATIFNQQQDSINKISSIPINERVVHAPIFEEIIYRAYIRNFMKLQLNVLSAGIKILYYVTSKLFAKGQDPQINIPTDEHEQLPTQTIFQNIMAHEDQIISLSSSINSTLIFTGHHMDTQKLPAFIQGMVYSQLTENSASIVPSIAAHMTNNYIAALPMTDAIVENLATTLKARIT